MQHPTDLYQQTYHRVKTVIDQRYRHFNAVNERGYQGSSGITSGIKPVGLTELIHILFHIANNKALLDQSRKRSAKTAILAKLHLMSGDEKNWNLRLHRFPLDDCTAETPHHHRWTLASKILKGGYVNHHYAVTVKPPKLKDKARQCYAYTLPATVTGQGKVRQATVSKHPVYVLETGQTVYHQGHLKHFPIAEAHSVNKFPQFFGTTWTLAHTSEAQHTESRFYPSVKQKSNEVELEKYDNNAQLRDALLEAALALQLIQLANDLNAHLLQREKHAPLTTQERRHLKDFKAFNYFETSFLPALSLWLVFKVTTEFQEATYRFLTSRLRTLDKSHLIKRLIKNQHDLFNKRLTLIPLSFIRKATKKAPPSKLSVEQHSNPQRSNAFIRPVDCALNSTLKQAANKTVSYRPSLKIRARL